LKRANTIFALSIISIFLCWIAGAIATYNAYQAQQDALAGNLLEAENGIRKAKVWMILSFAFLGVALLVNVFLRLTGN
jgi:hypothetical protein